MTQSNSQYQLLVAEDDATSQYVFRTILQGAGYRVTLVDNGLHALESARTDPPDIFLLDMMMPVMNGYEAAWRIIQDPIFDGIPIIALTARAMQGDADRTLRAGCDDYVSKPIRRQEFLDKVAFWLDRDSEEWMPRRLSMRVPHRENV
jgi:CheY-like chemotaxis protein